MTTTTNPLSAFFSTGTYQPSHYGVADTSIDINKSGIHVHNGYEGPDADKVAIKTIVIIVIGLVVAFAIYCIVKAK